MDLDSDAGWLYSADSHIVEPGDLWHANLPQRLRAAAPRLVGVTADERPLMAVDGVGFVSVGDPGDATEVRAGSDVKARVADLNADGVWGELVAPTLGCTIYLLRDASLAYAAARVYNEWVVELTAEHRGRLATAAIIPINDLKCATKELLRAHGDGMRAAALPFYQDEARPYTMLAFDTLWEAAAAMDMPVVFHVSTGHHPPDIPLPGSAVERYVRASLVGQRLVTQFAASGILERHPNLTVIVAECGAGWLAPLLERLDEAVEEHPWHIWPKLARPPSEYVRRQCHVTFSRESQWLTGLDGQPPEMYLWASDYPHGEGTWPNSRTAVDELLAGVDVSIRQTMVADSTRELFSLSAPQAAASIDHDQPKVASPSLDDRVECGRSLGGAVRSQYKP